MTHTHHTHMLTIMHLQNNGEAMKHLYSHVLTSIEMCFEVGGTIVGVFVYPVYYLGLVTQSDVCEDGHTLLDPNLRAAYHWHALTLSVIILFCISTTVIGVRE